ncbi:GTP cyclohydrolase 1 type 2 [Bacteroidia bacterium]|nr:GTP cyclohydrolase 1 type 2 [Bacteroidia bacterium]GHT84444.1 GTP cyclohydrolase 1 type 2 [Bacteroidia bacterium]
MKISQIIETLENYAPLSLQESFDNSGLQVGDVSRKVTGILLCLDVTEEVLDEAIELDCNLIISHHPLLFKPLKSLSGKTYIERCVIKACRNNLVIYASHTNMDNAFGGVNFRIAEKIGLQNVRVLSPQKNCLLKLVTFVPEAQAETVRNALFNAGAGHTGNYDSCSFNVSGSGTFRAGEDTNPFVGNINELHTEPEIRIETIVPVYKKSTVLRTLLAVHPYEEPVYDFYTLDNNWNQAGSGVVGELPYTEEEAAFLQKLKMIFKLKNLKHSPFTGKEIREVAICGGSGAFLIPEAIAYGADIFITGEARYNDYYDVENRILLAVIGHYESEIITKELFYDIITKKITNFAVHFSTVNSNPVNYM